MYRAFAITSKLSVPLQTNGVGIDGARILAILLIVLGLSAISIGLSIYLTGAPHTGEITTQLYDHLTRMPHGSVPLDGPTVDSELQFFAPFWMAYGAMLIVTARKLKLYLNRAPLLSAVFFAGGVGQAGPCLCLHFGAAIPHDGLKLPHTFCVPDECFVAKTPSCSV